MLGMQSGWLRRNIETAGPHMGHISGGLDGRGCGYAVDGGPRLAAGGAGNRGSPPLLGVARYPSH